MKPFSIVLLRSVVIAAAVAAMKYDFTQCEMIVNMRIPEQINGLNNCHVNQIRIISIVPPHDGPKPNYKCCFSLWLAIVHQNIYATLKLKPFCLPAFFLSVCLFILLALFSLTNSLAHSLDTFLMYFFYSQTQLVSR